AGVAGAENREDSPETAFLRGRAMAMDLTRLGGGLPADAIEVDGKRLFLLGEVHGVAQNYAIDLALLQHLHSQADVRVDLVEFSHAHAQLINRYLETGDARPLDFTLEQLFGFTDGSQQRRAFFTALRDWNLTLPVQDRVR